ncbi:MAG: flavodoxin family protein [bacterium]|nr:flavodoxin family protein [bacterium]
MKTVICDLPKKYIPKIENYNFISSVDCKYHCVGCFSCWIKTPSKCIISDEYNYICNSLNKSDELIIISNCRYACYSSDVKRVLERCIGYVLPYFEIRKGVIHHKSRYDNKLNFTVYFYGNIKEEDKTIIENLVKANSINLNAKNYKVSYFKNIKEVIKCLH